MLALAAASSTLLALAPPALQMAGHPEPSWLIRLLLSPLCHQDPLRSFHLWGSPAALCARCLAVHAGVLAGALVLGALGAAVFRAARTPGNARIVLAVGAAPAAVQWLLARLLPGLPALDGNLPRAMTGLILGGSLAIVLAGALDAILHRLPSPAAHVTRSPAQGGVHAPAAD